MRSGGDGRAARVRPHRPRSGRLATNIVHFARTLRAAGLRVGPGQVLRAIEAVEAAGLRKRDDFYWTLHSVFVNRRDQREIFDQAFHVYWRNPRLLEKMMEMLLPQVGVPADPEQQQGAQPPPAGGACSRGRARRPGRRTSRPRSRSRRPSPSPTARCCSTATSSRCRRPRSTRRCARSPGCACRCRSGAPAAISPSRRGARIDFRASLRRALRPEGLIDLRRREPRRRPPPLVILCDISGSMARYSRMFLHFMHAITNDRDRVYCFTFGTRLSNVSRALRNRDVDIALQKASAQVEDWSGGTRIGQTLHEFNNKWSRRVLGQGAVVLLITDGLDREGAAGLAEEMERLHKSCSPPDLAQPALAVRRLRAQIPGQQGDAAPCRRVPAGAQSRKPGRADRRPGQPRPAAADRRLVGWQTELRKE